MAGTQSCQNHLAGPVKKVVCILLLSGFQRCFDDCGLFMVVDALIVLRTGLADLLARCQGFRSVMGSIGELLCMSSCICVARRGDLFVWRASNTDKASVRRTVGEYGPNESLTKIAVCLSASVSAL